MLDRNLPGVDGVEVCRRIKRDPVLADSLVVIVSASHAVPVILASGYSEAQVMEGQHPELPQACLSKPYGQEQLREALSKALDTRMID